MLNSHADLPVVDSARDDIMKRDVAPYSELFSKINARLSAVMVGHAHYSAFDGTAPLPASLSKNVVTGLLREELGFKGLAITDDLDMGAITSTREIGEAAIQAIEAGHDMVMVTGSIESVTAAWQAMNEAARDGRITKTHIRRAFDHIARIKSMLSPPHALNDGVIARLRERVTELNLILQHAK
jgi:beta-N-acetylhexosaminidase